MHEQSLANSGAQKRVGFARLFCFLCRSSSEGATAVVRFHTDVGKDEDHFKRKTGA